MTMWDPAVLRVLAGATGEGWGGIRRSKGFAEIARESGFSEARVALSLKKAAQAGLCRPTSDRSLQIRYVITDAGEIALGLREARLPAKTRLRAARIRLSRRLKRG